MSDRFVQPEEEKVKGGSIYCLQLPKGGYRGDGTRHFSDMHRERTRGNGHKLEQRKLQLKPWTELFPVRVVQPWDRVDRWLAHHPWSPSIRVMALSNMIWLWS